VSAFWAGQMVSRQRVAEGKGGTGGTNPRFPLKPVDKRVCAAGRALDHGNYMPA